jgi:hypothetical protein
MTPLTSQDPIEAFRLRIAEYRLVPREAGPSGLFAWLIRALILRMFSNLADVLEQVRADVRAAAARAAAAPPDAPDQPRQSNRPEHRIPEAACGAGVTHEPCEPPEMAEPIAEVPQVGRGLPPPCPMPAVELPRARVRSARNKSAPAPARPRHVDDGCWPQWRGPGILSTAEAGFLRFDSKKLVGTGGGTCAHFVTI